MASHHERLLDQHTCTVADLNEALRLRRRQGDGFFAQHVLPVLGRFLGPGHVKVVGQGVVNGLDLGVGEKGLVGAMRRRNAESVGHFPRPGEVARSNRHEAASLAFHQGGYDMFERDLGGAEDPPSNLVHKWTFPLRWRAPPHAVKFAAMLRDPWPPTDHNGNPPKRRRRGRGSAHEGYGDRHDCVEIGDRCSGEARMPLT